MCDTRTVTPPSCPIYGVQLTQDEIEAIVETSLKNVQSVTSARLPSGSSYNNRIYSVDVVLAKNHHTLQLILKVSGWPTDWKHYKVQNEVLALSLVKKYCPEIPVPEVIACCDGIETACHDDDDLIVRKPIQTACKEWILMSRLPGQRISGSQLSREEHESLRGQVAEAFVALRLKMPKAERIGNLQMNDSYKNNNDFLEGPRIGKLLNFPDAKGAPFPTLLLYYASIFHHEISLSCKFDEVMKPNRSLIQKLQHHISNTLPMLSLFRDTDLPLTAFTHGDFSDRNLLYVRDDKENRVKLSGWVDWEFAGYYNPFEEFLMLEEEDDFVGRDSYETSSGEKNPDAKPSLYKFYTILEDHGVHTPLQETKAGNAISRHWITAQNLYQIQCNIIPWFIRVKWDAGEKEGLNADVKKAGKALQTALDWFERF